MEEVTIKLTKDQHRELLAIIMRYTTRNDRWAVSNELRMAVTEPVFNR